MLIEFSNKVVIVDSSEYSFHRSGKGLEHKIGWGEEGAGHWEAGQKLWGPQCDDIGKTELMAERLSIWGLMGWRWTLLWGPGARTKENKDVSMLSHPRNRQKGLARFHWLRAPLWAAVPEHSGSENWPYRLFFCNSAPVVEKEREKTMHFAPSSVYFIIFVTSKPSQKK